ncbi:hypothetical protein PoB_007257900 [Plakobranchus ocellatus]|uniref:Uncharacterized protein n=1 Tax=Plakobranchus ocellatus TaxID=259542 RepID=A0AAV4DPD1_9GAST|nr:hypothetical protein PoB_007257900 [Plakobranchus ocellatus]
MILPTRNLCEAWAATWAPKLTPSSVICLGLIPVASTSWRINTAMSAPEEGGKRIGESGVDVGVFNFVDDHDNLWAYL